MYTFRRSIQQGTGLALILALLLLGGSSYAQLRVTKVMEPESLAGNRGVVYSLPRTVLVVDITVMRTNEIPGPFAAFAEEMLGVDNVNNQPLTTYTLEKATISSFVEPDPEQVYLVELDEKASEEVLLEFTENGMLAGADVLTVDEMTRPAWFEVFKTSDPEISELFPYYREASLKEITDTITREVTFDTLTYQEKILKRLNVRQTEREKASEALTMIHDISQDQYSLLVGYQETPYSYEAIKFMYDQLEAQRRNYLQLFTGITQRELFQVRYFVIPDQDIMQEAYNLAGFSTANGISENDGDQHIHLVVQGHGLTSMIGSSTEPVTGIAGYYYRIPENCHVSVDFDGNVLAEQDLIINQAGVVRSLSPGLTRVKFNPLTGGISKMVLK